MITADVSCRLLEVDFSGIEAVLTGRQLWQLGFSSDGAKQYIRLSRLGMHAAVTALKMDRPVDLTAADDVVKPQLDAIKKQFPVQYDTAKRTVHAKNFGMTAYGQVEKFPEFFPTLKVAEEFERFYYALAPDLPHMHRALRLQAKDVGYLGGPTLDGKPPTRWDHPYGYRHWFWDVFTFQPINEFTARKWLKDPTRSWRVKDMHGRWFKIQPSGDFNRVIAFYPQSIAAGRLKEAELRLFTPWSPDYIGDCYFGRTPLLDPIHDSLLLIIPVRIWDRVLEIVARVMQEPSGYLPIPPEWGWGPYQPIGISAKAGKNWAPHIDADEQIKIKLKTGHDVRLNPSGMEEIAVPKFAYPILHPGPDDPVLPREGEGEEEEWNLLKRAVA